jgi:hypothetical protein
MRFIVLALAIASVSAGTPAIARLGRFDRHLPPRSRFLEAFGGNGSSIPANGAVWPTAIYWCNVEVGTPSQTFPVAIDSGSGDLDISGKGCDGCVTTPPNNAYDHTASSTAAPAFPRKFSNSYQTCDLSDPTAVCTISGGLYTDKVSLAGLGPVDVELGSIEKQTSNFDQFKQIDGVMGFTMASKKNVFTQLVAAGKSDNIWAMCMTQGSKSNGTITIGGVDPRLSVDGKVNYVPDAGRGFREVAVASLDLGGSGSSGTASIGINSNAILDTGTNVLLLPKTAMNSLQVRRCTHFA